MLGEDTRVSATIFTSLIVNFSRHLYIEYIQNAFRTPTYSCACYFPAAHLNCWHENARTLDILWKVTWCFVDLHRNMSVFAKLSRTLGYLPLPSLRSSFIRTDLLSFQTIWEQGQDAGLQIQSFDFLDWAWPTNDGEDVAYSLHELVHGDARGPVSCRSGTSSE